MVDEKWMRNGRVLDRDTVMANEASWIFCRNLCFHKSRKEGSAGGLKKVPKMWMEHDGTMVGKPTQNRLALIINFDGDVHVFFLNVSTAGFVILLECNYFHSQTWQLAAGDSWIFFFVIPCILEKNPIVMSTLGVVFSGFLKSGEIFAAHFFITGSWKKFCTVASRLHWSWGPKKFDHGGKVDCLLG